MSTTPETARQFWCAAYYYRRAGTRGRDTALKILNHLRRTATGKVNDRATQLLKEANEPDRHD